MVLEEDWGIPPERVRQFFLAQPDVSELPGGFQFRGCHICLMPTHKTLLGNWTQARTILRIEGTDTDVQAIHRRFFLQFLSAGG